VRPIGAFPEVREARDVGRQVVGGILVRDGCGAEGKA
jgi:hypothetical protein